MTLKRAIAFIEHLRRRSALRARVDISLQETDFQLHPTDRPDAPPNYFQWGEITTVLAYKRDCFSVDLICLAVGDASTVVEINEEDAGWEAFIRAMEKNLPGSLPFDAWWPAVAQPPFATHRMTVYSKELSPKVI
jgi:hypothetical protein